MPIQLDKILADIALEKALHPNYPNATKKEMDDAWTRVGKSNKLSVHEARSIFKVLQKKYDQEKSKGSTAWKLYNVMEEIHSKKETRTISVKNEEQLGIAMEEDEEYEMLEVQEEDENQAQQIAIAPNSAGSASDGESPTKSNSSTESQEKEDKPPAKRISTQGLKSAAAAASVSNTARSSAAKSTPIAEEKKLLNSLVCTRQSSQTPTVSAANLHKKGITMRKSTSNTPQLSTRSQNANNANAKVTPTTPLSSTRSQIGTTQSKNAATPRGGALDIGKTIRLPESIKRKLSEERSPSTATATTQPQIKKINLGHAAQQSKTDRGESPDKSTPASSVHGINLITIPSNLSNGGSSSACALNGFSPRIEDIDFKNEIIFDASQNPSFVSTEKQTGATTSSDVNGGNLDNALPPIFLKNLCNSSRYEALGLYVANVMNRLPSRSAAKLELGILRAITDVQDEQLQLEHP